MLLFPIFGAFIWVIWMVFFIVGVGGFVFWLFMLIDAAKHKFKKDDERIVWILVIALTGIIGALIYYFMVRRKAKK